MNVTPKIIETLKIIQANGGFVSPIQLAREKSGTERVSSMQRDSAQGYLSKLCKGGFVRRTGPTKYEITEQGLKVIEDGNDTGTSSGKSDV